MNFDKEIIQYLENLSEKFNYKPIIRNTIEDTILQTLIGSSRTIRLGSKPSESTIAEILNRIHQKVKKNLPLEISSAWGAIKTIPTKNKGVDLAEFLMLKQFHSISKVIKSIYSPGIKFNIYLGDSYYTYLYEPDCNIANYIKGMELISKNHEEINLVNLSTLCKNVPQTTHQCENNYNLLHRYWIDSSSVPIELHSELLAYKELSKAGWIGRITPAMREFYIKRMSLLYPEQSNKFWLEKTLHFFAYGLMISQNDLMGRKSLEKSTVDACLLRVPPPDLPRELYSNRIRMRIAPQSIVKSSAPPWTVAGIIQINNNDPHIKLINGSYYKSLQLRECEYSGINFGVLYI